MQNFDLLLKQRRSIRKYKKEVPPAELIKELVSACLQTPSPSNTQPVRFIRIVSEAIRLELLQKATEGYEKLKKQVEESEGSNRNKNIINYYWHYSLPLFNAPVLLAVGVSAEAASFAHKLGKADIIKKDLITTPGLSITAGMSIMALMLKAAELEIGTCIFTAPLVFLPSDISTIIGVPNISICCFLALGYPDEVPENIKRKDLKQIYCEI